MGGDTHRIWGSAELPNSVVVLIGWGEVGIEEINFITLFLKRPLSHVNTTCIYGLIIKSRYAAYWQTYFTTFISQLLGLINNILDFLV